MGGFSSCGERLGPPRSGGWTRERGGVVGGERREGDGGGGGRERRGGREAGLVGGEVSNN